MVIAQGNGFFDNLQTLLKGALADATVQVVELYNALDSGSFEALQGWPFLQEVQAYGRVETFADQIKGLWESSS